MPKRLAVALALLAGLVAGAADLPYNESADAKAELSRALADAAPSGKPVLVIFGANWCEDCRALDLALKSGKNAALVSEEFKLVKVDVGRFDRNLDIANAYGNPIRKGIPAAVIVGSGNRVLYATRAGELADARSMNADGIYGFFRDAMAKAKASH